MACNKVYKLSDSDIELIKDPMRTADELAIHFGCGTATITRWRKKYGWNGNIGSKKGVKRPQLQNGKNVNCSVCDKEFYLALAFIASREHFYCSKKCMHLCEIYRNKISSAQKKSWDSGERKPVDLKEHVPEFIRYRNKVHRLSDIVYNENIDIINPHRYPRTLAGVDGGWQLDHIVEIKFGFENNIPPEVLAEVENLRMLPWKDNLARNRKDNNGQT